MNIAAAWVLTVALHGVLLLIAAWLIERTFALRNAQRELLWRAALFGGVLTATLQIASGHSPFAGRWHWADSHAASTSAIATTSSKAEQFAVTRTASTPQLAHPIETVPSAVSPTPQWHLPSPAVVLMLWSTGALLMLIRTLTRWLLLRRVIADIEPLLDDALIANAVTIARDAKVQTPRLFTLDPLASPIALHGHRIVLPAWAVASLDDHQLRAMIAHEMAHLARRDPAWKALTASWSAVFWFVPNVGARRRLDDLAELACDAFAANCLGDARGLAECLAVCAEHHVGAATFHLAAAMAARPSSLWIRIDRLLGGVAMDTAPTGIGARMIALSVLIASAFALPAVGIDAQAASLAGTSTSTPADGKRHASLGVHSDSHSTTSTTVVSFSDDTKNFTANVNGTMALNDTETDIVLSEHATARLEETQNGVTQRIELTERDGALQRRYFVDNAEHPYDEKARAFMAEIVTDLARSGVGADVRAQRLYTEGGAPRVLDEIAKLHSSYAGGIYLGTLLDQGPMSAGDLDRAITLAGGFDSDYERHQALSHLIDTQSLDAQRQIAVLKQVGQMQTDYDRAEMLVQIAEHLVDSTNVRDAWMQSARGLKSDYDRRRSYEALLTRGGTNAAQIATVIEASASLNSDYDHGELLKAAVQQAGDGEAIAEVYEKSANSIGSDYNRREALMALMAADHFGPRAADAVLDGAGKIESSYERTQVLVALAHVMPLDDAHVVRYRALAARLSELEREQAESALVF